MSFSPKSLLLQSMLLTAAVSLILLSCSRADGQAGQRPPSAAPTAATASEPPVSTSDTPSPGQANPTATAISTPTITNRDPGATATPTATPLIANPTPAVAMPTSAPVEEAQRGGTLNLASRQAITGYDVHNDVSPALSTWGPGIAYSRLMRFKSGPGVALPSLQVECDLCSTWRMVDDMTFEFEIRANATWQAIGPVNGRPVTAEDVAFSYRRQQQSGSPNANLLHMLDGVEATDQVTLRLYLKAPDTDFMVALADGHSKVVAAEAVAAAADLPDFPTVGSGPWILTESRPESRHFFEANADYYEEGYPLLDRLNIHVLQDADTRDAAFQVRSIDVQQMSPAQWREHVRRVPDAPFLFSPDQGTGLEVAMNAGSEPFRDARLRRAAMLSMDPWAAVEDIWLSGAVVGQGVPSPAADWLLAEEVMRTYFGDATQARALVAESRGESPIRLTMKVGDFGDAFLDHAGRIAEEMRAVGFDAELEIVNRRYFGEEVWLGGDYQMFAGPMAPVISPNAYLLSVLHSGGRWNTTGVYNASLDALIEAQARELDPAKRKELFLEVQRRAMDDAHRFVAAGGVSIWTWWPRVKGLNPNFAGFEYSHWSKVSVR